MIIYNKLDNYFIVSAERQKILVFEMTATLRDTSPLTMAFLPVPVFITYGFLPHSSMCSNFIVTMHKIFNLDGNH